MEIDTTTATADRGRRQDSHRGRRQDSLRIRRSLGVAGSLRETGGQAVVQVATTVRFSLIM